MFITITVSIDNYNAVYITHITTAIGQKRLHDVYWRPENRNVRNLKLDSAALCTIDRTTARQVNRRTLIAAARTA